MDAPGMSLFDGVGSLHLNTSALRPEEEEDIIEQRRLREELQQDLNALDDFIDDDEESYNESFRSLNPTRASTKSHAQSSGLKNKHSEHHLCGDAEPANQNFRTFNGARVNRNTPSDHGQQEHRGYNNYSPQLAAQERPPAPIQSNDHMQHCYQKYMGGDSEANSKLHVENLQHEVSLLHSKIVSLERHNEELQTEVAASTASLMDAQHRLQAAKLNKDSAQTSETLLKAQQQRYKEDTDRLENDLSRTRNKLIEKENEFLSLETRYRDMERLKENLLVEKGSIINKLAMELEEAQHQLAAGEAAKLKERLAVLAMERDAARSQVKSMAGKLEATVSELVDSRYKVQRMQEDMTELESTLVQMAEGRESDSFRSSQTGRGFSSQTDKATLLRTELTKSITSQKLKREQINKLNKSLALKEKLVEELKDSEIKFKVEIESYKEKNLHLCEELKQMQMKLEAQKSSFNPELLEILKTRCLELEAELKMKKDELNSLNLKYSNLETKHEEINSDTGRRKSFEKHETVDLMKNCDLLSHQLKDARKQIDDFKNMYIEVCGSKEKLLKEINELNMNDVNQLLSTERNLTKELKIQLNQEISKVEKLEKHLSDQQIHEFNGHLENYKQTMESTDLTSKISKSNSRDNTHVQLEREVTDLNALCVEQRNHIKLLSKDLEESKQMIIKLNVEIELQGKRETLIADLKEKAKQFEEYIQARMASLMNRRDAQTSPIPELLDEKHSFNISDIEQTIKKEIALSSVKELKNIEYQFDQKISDLEQQYNSNLTQITDVLKVKTREVEVLREVIILERKKLEEALLDKTDGTQKNIKYENCKNELEGCRKHILKLNSDIESLKIQHGPADIKHLNNKFANTMKELDRMKEKYKTVKKTALVYKEYITEKDKQVERIKLNYEESKSSMQLRLNDYIKRNDQHVKLQLSDIKNEYAEKLSNLQHQHLQQVT